VKTYLKTTNSEGKCTFYNIVENNFTISVLDSTTSLRGGASGKLYGPGSEDEITVLLEPSGTVKGKVYHPDSTNPVFKCAGKIV